MFLLIGSSLWVAKSLQSVVQTPEDKTILRNNKAENNAGDPDIVFCLTNKYTQYSYYQYFVLIIYLVNPLFCKTYKCTSQRKEKIMPIKFIN